MGNLQINSNTADEGQARIVKRSRSRRSPRPSGNEWQEVEVSGEGDVFDKGTQEIIRDAILKGGMDKETAVDVAKKLGASLLASLIYSKTRDFFRNLPERVKSMYEDRQLLQVKLPNEEVAKWLVTYVHEQGMKGENGNTQFEALVDDSIEFRNNLQNVGNDVLRGRELVKLIPSADADTTQFQYNDHTFEINRQYKNPKGPENTKSSAYRGKPQWYLKTWTADREDVRELLEEVAAAAFHRSKERVKIHRMNNFGNWRSQGFSEGMKLESLILEEGQREEIVHLMENFLQDKEFSRKYGTPWRIGFLLEGPHGTGKTSLVRAMAYEYEMDLYEVNVCNAEMDDATLKRAMANIGEGEIALIEDVDAIFDNSDDGPDTSVTPRGFSTAIDGVAEQPGRVLFMTTNNADMLTERVTRPGRADHIFRLGLATRDMARRLFLKFNEGHNDMAMKFAEEMGDRNYSPAAIQKHFTKYRDPKTALENVDEVREPQRDYNA